MTDNLVYVTGQWGDATVGYGQGNYLFAATGTLITSAYTTITYPVMDGILDAQGNLGSPSGVPLLASDNYSAGVLNWNCFLRIQGQPLIHVTSFAVNFANGSSQPLFQILQTAGWTPLVG